MGRVGTITSLVSLGLTIMVFIWTMQARTEDRLAEHIDNVERRLMKRIGHTEDNLKSRVDNAEDNLKSRVDNAETNLAGMENRISRLINNLERGNTPK